jgi:hypothetical protein
MWCGTLWDLGDGMSCKKFHGMTNFTLQRSKTLAPRELVEIPVSSSVWKINRRSHSHRHYTVVCDSDVEIRAAPTYSDEVDFHMEN